MQSSQLHCIGESSRDCRIVQVCIDKRCSFVPFICNDSLCECHNIHTNHMVQPYDNIRRLLSDEPLLNPDVKKGLKTVDIMLMRAEEIFEMLSVDHARLSEAHISQLKCQEIQQQFLTGNGNYPFTGGIICEMLEELKEPNIQYPYKKSRQELTDSFNDLVMKKLEEVEKIIRQSWMFDVSKSKATFSPHETFSLELKKKLLPEAFGRVNQHIKAIIVEKCEADKWQPITASISLNSFLLELAMCDCRLLDADVEPLWEMAQLRRLSLENNLLTEQVLMKATRLPSIANLNLDKNPLCKHQDILQQLENILAMLPHIETLSVRMPLVDEITLDLRKKPKFLAALILIQNAPNLTTLFMAHPSLNAHPTKDELIRLASCLAKLEQLALSKCNCYKATINVSLVLKTIVDNLKCVTKLGLVLSGINDALTEIICTGLPRLQKLNLCGNHIGPEAANSIIKLKYLWSLELSDTIIGDEGVIILSVMQSLGTLNISSIGLTKHLYIGTSDGIIMNNIVMKLTMPSLAKRYDWAGFVLGQEIIDAMVKNLKQLKTLSISTFSNHTGSTGLTDWQLFMIAEGLPQLTTLSIGSVLIDEGYNGLPRELIDQVQLVMPKTEIQSE